MDARDIDNDGRPEIFETALEGESWPLFRNLGKNLFDEISYASGLTLATISKAGWSNGIFDFNNDGWKDLFVARARVEDPAGSQRGLVADSNAVFVNLKDGKFKDVSSDAGPDFQRKAVHRGTAFGDIDNDGRIDVVVTALDAPIEVWRNVSPSNNHWLLIKLVGTKSNRDGMGAKIRMRTKSAVHTIT